MMTRSRTVADDALLRRTRRAVARAKSCVAGSGDRRRVLIAAADLSAFISQLVARSRELDRELQAATRRSDAMSAYDRCLKLRRRPPRA